MKRIIPMLLLAIPTLLFPKNTSIDITNRMILKLRYDMYDNIYYNNIQGGISNYRVLKKISEKSGYPAFLPNEEMSICLCLHQFEIITDIRKFYGYIYFNHYHEIDNSDIIDGGLKDEFTKLAIKNEKSISNRFVHTVGTNGTNDFFQLFTRWYLHSGDYDRETLSDYSEKYLKDYPDSPYNMFISNQMLVNKSSTPVHAKTELIFKFHVGLATYTSFSPDFHNHVEYPFGFNMAMNIRVGNFAVFAMVNSGTSKTRQNFTIESTPYSANKYFSLTDLGILCGYLINDTNVKSVDYYPVIGFSRIGYFSLNAQTIEIKNYYYYIKAGLIMDLINYRFLNMGAYDEFSIRIHCILNIPVDYSRINDFNNFSMSVGIALSIGLIFPEKYLYK